MMRSFAVLFLSVSLAFSSDPPKFAVTPEMQSAMERISPESLKGHLSFIASDLLEGRNTPSPGLEIAAEYIAAQFRRAGLEPGGEDGGYFQTAKLFLQEPNPDGFALEINDGDKSVAVAPERATLLVNAALDLTRVPVFKLDLSDAAMLEALTPDQVNGKVVFMELARGRAQSGASAMRKLRSAKPALLLTLDRAGSNRPAQQAQLFDPDNQTAQTPRVIVSGEAPAQLYESMKSGLTASTLTIHVAAPKQQPVRLRNVVAILRGSDPRLKETCVLVTAHYDHIGIKASGDGDRIYNGANDDGSGTVSVIELAGALSKMKQHPKRSIVFATFFGEEKGGFGSRYYANHPVFPIEKTVADLNLEQIGRTDSSEGAQLANASLTGFDYSNVADYVKAAGEMTGVKVYKNDKNSDSYFARSDNLSLAEKGVPAHTLTVAFAYPDYHGLGDEWQKIDYENMAKVDRMVALALLMLADSTDAPHWDASNPKVKSYLKAWTENHTN
ncbi:MAG: M28 family peptidase [Acidobacteriota bacterium]|nr:M28 family peptidase [Acidobacteriota bacterium]